MCVVFNNERQTKYTLSKMKLKTITSVFAALTVAATAQTKLVIKGSDTLGAKMVPQLSEAYKAAGNNVDFEIAAEGSSTCFTALLAGTADFGMSSRGIKSKEKDQFAAKGQEAVAHVAGVDMIAPSGMMDGMITAIRAGLDGAGFENLPVMSYSTKFASAYYGPFRDVAESSPSYGDRRSYQMNPANRNEAILESVEDEKEGADILMVKPALAYLDIVRDVKNNTSLPLAVYNVSGEYSMLKMAAKAGVIDYDKVMMETMMAFKRAGADIIITYHAKEAALLLQK